MIHCSGALSAHSVHQLSCPHLFDAAFSNLPIPQSKLIHHSGLFLASSCWPPHSCLKLVCSSLLPQHFISPHFPPADTPNQPPSSSFPAFSTVQYSTPLMIITIQRAAAPWEKFCLANVQCSTLLTIMTTQRAAAPWGSFAWQILVKHWNRLPKKWRIHCPWRQSINKCADVAPGDTL